VTDEQRIVALASYLREAELDDAALLERWNRDPGVIAGVTDDPNATTAFGVPDWRAALAAQTTHSRYYIAVHAERPVGALEIMDPQLEPAHYWGDVAPNLRAVDIWIGGAADRGRGLGTEFMRLALALCFHEPAVTAVVIDPLASNVRAHAFYRRLGFTPVERRRFGDSDCFVHRLSREGWQRSDLSRSIESQ
jgi:aminoglycoside 6'-N-acetyltransferase